MNKRKSFTVATSCAALLSIGSYIPMNANVTLPIIQQAFAQEASALTGNPVKAGDTSVSGTATAGSTVTVRFPSGDKVTVDASSNGAWSVAVPGGVSLKEGDVIALTSITTDNLVSDTEVTVGVKANAPANSTQPLAGGTTTVAETTTTAGTTTVAGETTTTAGTTTVAGETTTAAPNANTANFVRTNSLTAGDRVVTGTTAPNATVTVQYEATGDKVTVDANAKGEWSIEFPANVQLKEADIVNVTSIDSKDSVANEEVVVQGAVAAKTQAQTTTAPAKKGVLPSTGEHKNMTSVAALGIVLVGLSLFVLGRKKKDAE